MAAAAAASWYHCSLKTLSRSDGRSAVASAAYRVGEKLMDERYARVQDYSRRKGIEFAFSVAPDNAPVWAFNPERLWNEAELAETRINSRLAREVELALPSFLSTGERRAIVQEYAQMLVDRYGVAVTAAGHEPGKGDDRNYHAHILFTTREMTAEGLGKKTRILDDKKTGPREVESLRQLAAEAINRHLSAAHSDIRVDHRSFEVRGIEREPSTHLGPAASEMERRDIRTERGDMNRQAQESNALSEEIQALDEAIEQRREFLSSPPRTAEEAREKMQQDIAAQKETVTQNGRQGSTGRDGLRWYERAALQIAWRAHTMARALAAGVRNYWQEMVRDSRRDHGRDRNPEDGGMDR